MSEQLIGCDQLPDSLLRAGRYAQSNLGCEQFKLIGTGETADVALANDVDGIALFVLKSIRNQRDYTQGHRLDKAWHEQNVLQAASASTAPPPLEIPRVVFGEYGQAWFILSFVPGDVLDDATLARMNNHQRRHLGHSIGQMISWFADAVAFVPGYGLGVGMGRRPAFDKRAQIIEDSTFEYGNEMDERGQHAIAHAASLLLAEWCTIIDDERVKRSIMGHNDLRPANFVFRRQLDNPLLLSGVIDFGEALHTTPEQEMRHLVLLGDDIVAAAIHAYEQAKGVEVDKALVHFWAKVQEVSAAITAVRSIAPPEIMLKKRQRLERVWPEIDWREVDGTLRYK